MYYKMKTSPIIGITLKNILSRMKSRPKTSKLKIMLIPSNILRGDYQECLFQKTRKSTKIISS